MNFNQAVRRTVIKVLSRAKGGTHDHPIQEIRPRGVALSQEGLRELAIQVRRQIAREIAVVDRRPAILVTPDYFWLAKQVPRTPATQKLLLGPKSKLVAGRWRGNGGLITFPDGTRTGATGLLRYRHRENEKGALAKVKWTKTEARIARRRGSL